MFLRSLLIDSAQLDELKIDGPALCLSSSGKSRQRFPFRRLSQVICIGLPTEGIDTLFATANQGIPVSFFNRRGKIIAQLIHPGALPHPLAHWLEASGSDPLLKEVYQQWLENQLRHTYALIGCVARHSRYSAVRAQAQLDKLSKQARCKTLLDGAREWFEGLLTARLQVHAVRFGLSANSSMLATIIEGLLEAGTLLCLTWLVLNVRDNGGIPPSRAPFFFEGPLSRSVDEWVARALFTLSNQLEQRALDQDAPYPEARQ
ncbi:MAG: CRISPR-associated endonuclease Cas1 [Porticoccaceae bacterium]